MTREKPGQPPPIPRKPTAPRKGRQREATPEQRDAEARMRAAKLCTTSMYAAFAAGPVYFFMGLGALMAAGLAIATGVIGLVGLLRVGMGPPLTAEVTGLVRVSVRLAKRARPQAGLGIGLGLVVCAIPVFAYLNQLNHRGRDQASYPLATEATGRDAPPGSIERMSREATATFILDLEVTKRMKSPAHNPRDPLPETELAAILAKFMADYGDTQAAEAIRTEAKEPFVTMRRILKEHGGSEGK